MPKLWQLGFLVSGNVGKASTRAFDLDQRITELREEDVIDRVVDTSADD